MNIEGSRIIPKKEAESILDMYMGIGMDSTITNKGTS